jgi:hypothetical protein
MWEALVENKCFFWIAGNNKKRERATGANKPDAFPLSPFYFFQRSLFKDANLTLKFRLGC